MLPAFRWRMHEITRVVPDADSSLTWRETYDNHLKNKGRRHPDDVPIEYPPGGDELQAYWDLDNGRQVAFSAQQITWADIDAYCRITGTRLHAVQLDILRAMDRVRFEIADKARRTKTPKEDKTKRRR